MDFDLHYGGQHIHQFDKDSLLTFFKLELKPFLNGNDDLPEKYSNQDIETAFCKWEEDNNFDTSYYPFVKYLNSFIDNGVDHEDLKELLSELNDLRSSLNSINSERNESSEQLKLIKELLIEFNINEYTDLLAFVRSTYPMDYNIVTNHTLKNIFRSNEAYKWFVEVIEERFGEINEKTRNFNAFLKALIDDEDVQNNIFFDHSTQKSIVEFINGYYGNGKSDIIKDPNKLSDPIKHKPYVNEKIKNFIKFRE